MFDFLIAAEVAAEEGMPSTGFSLISMLLTFGLFILIIWFMGRKQRKKEKETADMRKSLQIGDEVTTIGGITGIVLRKTEDTVVIETGGDKNKIRVKVWAIAENATVHDVVEEAPAPKIKVGKDKTID